MAKRMREKYNVYFEITHYGNDGEIDTNKTFVGQTYAVSEAQAENNVKFRRDGAVPNFAVHELPGDASVIAEYRAVPAASDI